MGAPVDSNPLEKLIESIRSRWSDAVRMWRSFQMTSRAINRGERLYEWPLQRLHDSGYLGPWGFAAAQVAIVGGVASVASKVAGFFSNSGPDTFVMDDDPRFTALVESVYSWVEPFILPVMFTAAVALVGWGSLHHRDVTPANTRRAKASYLYFNGAYGFCSQLMLASLLTFGDSEFGSRIMDYVVISAPGVLLFIATIFAQVFVTFSKVPKAMFVANGYRAKRAPLVEGSREDDPPSFKFFFSLLVASSPLVVVVWLLALGLSYALALPLLAIQEIGLRL